MKAVILAGGLGTRLAEETSIKPKPMVEIGGMPIIWHIMKNYSHFGINEFIICCGYKGYLIKEYFANYFLHKSDITFDMKSNEMNVHNETAEPWKVTLVDTGNSTMTGGRLKRIEEYIKDDDFFCFTYGDGLSSVNINELIKFHRKHQKKATLTSVIPTSRFGVIKTDNKNSVVEFVEKPENQLERINGGFFVLSPKVLDLIKSDDTIWEKNPLEELANQGELMSFEHNGFWKPMDTLRDKIALEELWDSGDAPWKLWD
jgi:glucose-1-phosphate cytidylyltransferase